MPSRMPSSSARRHDQQEDQEQPLAGLLGHRRQHRERHVVGHAGEQAADALHDERAEGRGERAPQQPQHQQPPGLGLVAVQPQVAEHQRDHRDRGQHGRQHRDRGRAGERDDQQHRERAEADQDDHHDGERPAVTAGCGHGGECRSEGCGTALRRRVASVSEEITTESTSESGEDDTKTARELHVESHDPAVPEAYSAFMRTGWGDRELDLPRQPVADRAAVGAREAGRDVPRRAAGAAGRHVQGAGQRHRLQVPPRHRAHLLLRQPDQRRRAGDRGRRGRPLRAAALRRATPTSSSATASTASCGSAAAPRSTSSPPRSASSAATSTGSRTPSPPPTAPEDPGAARDLGRGGPDGRRRRRPRRRTSQRVVGELRLVKDDWEVAELQEACDITTLGFEDSVREWKQVLEFGERWIEGTFQRRARAMGNDIGYDSIVGGGKHATTLHWIDNTGPITPGKLVLLDMGVEGRNLYTADVTRTLPVDGTFTPLQRDLYDLVYTAQQRASRRPSPASPFLVRAQRRDGRARARPRGPRPAAGLRRGGARPGLEGLRALDPARHQPHARHGRPRLQRHLARHLPQGQPRGRHGAHRRARALLPGGRPAGPRGAARHRHPDRGRHPRHRRRPGEPLGLAPPHLGRRRGVDAAQSTVRRGRRASAG